MTAGDTAPPAAGPTPADGDDEGEEVAAQVDGGGRRPRRGRERGRHAAGRARLTRRGRAVLVLAGLVVVVVAGLAAWEEVEANPSGGRGPALVVDVRDGEPVDALLADLTRDGVIGSDLAFRLWAVVHGEPAVEPGRYYLHRNSSFGTVDAVLDAGPDVFDVQVAPGDTLAEIASELSSIPGKLAASFDAGARSGSVSSPYQPSAGSSLEGLVGTGSYEVVPGETAHQLLEAMVARFDAEAAKAGLAPSTSVAGLGAYQIVTVASIAQKEGYFTRYFGDVARVIYNRLADGMALDMTSTVLYSLGQDGGTVTPAEEADTTPYNTYLHTGLTPTPICAPSEAALAAAVSPPAATWLYFDLVTAKRGTMVFSTTYTGQIAAEQQAAANRS